MSSKLEKEKYEDFLDYNILKKDPLNLIITKSDLMTMNSKNEKETNTNTRKLEGSPENLINEDKEPDDIINQSIENICYDNLITLEKIHAILINCGNLSKK